MLYSDRDISVDLMLKMSLNCVTFQFFFRFYYFIVLY